MIRQPLPRPERLRRHAPPPPSLHAAAPPTSDTPPVFGVLAYNEIFMFRGDDYNVKFSLNYSNITYVDSMKTQTSWLWICFISVLLGSPYIVFISTSGM